MYAKPNDARPLLSHYRVLRLTPEIAYTAAAIDHELIQTGQRLGENDNWIVGFCRDYDFFPIANSYLGTPLARPHL